jgi:hypothetical protein
VSNAGIAMIKIAVAAGGAALGVLLARWSDELISARLHEKSDFDKTRYAQGLGPQQPVQPVQPVQTVQPGIQQPPQSANDEHSEYA